MSYEEEVTRYGEARLKELPDVCVWPGRCWKIKGCSVLRNRLWKREELDPDLKPPCFLSLMAWANAPERLR